MRSRRLSVVNGTLPSMPMARLLMFSLTAADTSDSAGAQTIVVAVPGIAIQAEAFAHHAVARLQPSRHRLLFAPLLVEHAFGLRDDDLDARSGVGCASRSMVVMRVRSYVRLDYPR